MLQKTLAENCQIRENIEENDKQLADFLWMIAEIIADDILLKNDPLQNGS